MIGVTSVGVGVSQEPTEKQKAAMKAKAAQTKFKWNKKLETAQKQAKETGLPIIILFTGLKWCGPCQKFEKSVISKSAFKKGMNGVAIGVKVELKTPKDSPKEAKTYGVSGVPCMIMVDAEGKKLAQIPCDSSMTPEEFVETVKTTAAGKNVW